jgi:hypothetical protein
VTERILCAAIQVRRGTGATIVLAGHRHHNCIHAYADLLPPDARGRVGQDDQGFLTSRGRFVDRAEGWSIAEAAGQIIERPHQRPGMLFSEDLY